MIDESTATDATTTEPASAEELRACWGLVEDGYRSAHRMLSDDIESTGLPVQWFDVLTRLARTPEHRLPMNRLAATIEMTSGGFTKLVDRLEAADLVERIPAVDDRRVIFTALTPSGLRAATDAEERHDVRLREVLLGAVSLADLRQLGELMRNLRDAWPADDTSEEEPHTDDGRPATEPPQAR